MSEKRATIPGIVKSIVDVIQLFRDKSISKTMQMSHMNEKKLLPYLRFYLAGKYGKSLSVEIPCKYKIKKRTIVHEYDGRIDFKIGNVAVEIAVRTTNGNPTTLVTSSNEDELIKLMLYKNASTRLLILIDFSKAELRFDLLIDRMRDIATNLRVGSGNKKHKFTAAYIDASENNIVPRKGIITHK